MPAPRLSCAIHGTGRCRLAARGQSTKGRQCRSLCADAESSSNCRDGGSAVPRFESRRRGCGGEPETGGGRAGGGGGFRRDAVPRVPDFLHTPKNQGSPSGPPQDVGPLLQSLGAMSPLSPPPSQSPLSPPPCSGAAGCPLLPAPSGPLRH